MIIEQKESKPFIESEENGYRYVENVYPLTFRELDKSGVSWKDLTCKEIEEERMHQKKAKKIQYNVDLYNYFGMNQGNNKFYDRGGKLYRVKLAFPCMFVAQKVI